MCDALNKEKDLFDKCGSFTDARDMIAQGIYPFFRPLESAQDTEVLIGGKKLIMMGSNSYLGLTTDQRVKDAAINAVKKYGSGCAGSRFLNGTLDIHVKLEEKLADFMQKEASLIFSTGFQTNLGVISTIVGKGDYVIIDRLDHASIIEGCRLCFGQIRKYRHNDMDDLKRILEAIPSDAPKLIIVDGVFSMEGDLADLPGIVDLAERYNTRVFVDDAHGIGVMGEHGRGTAEHFGLQDKVDLIMGTFSKTFSSLGGFVAGKASVIHFIKHLSREVIFSASIPPSNVASVDKALDIIIEEPQRRKRLWDITHKMKRGLDDMGFDTGSSVTPIIPIFVRSNEGVFKMTLMLHEMGVFVNPVISPAVPPEHALIRTSFMATHTDEEIDFALNAIQTAGKEIGII